MVDDPTPPRSHSQERLERLTRHHATGARPLTRGYSRFIRRMRLFLPLLALVIAVLVMVGMNKQTPLVAPVPKTESNPPGFGKNELLNPRFESLDDKRQPFTITAARAIQGEKEENLLLLENPLADMLLNSGNWVAIEAKNGAYRQDTGRLLLRGDVKLYHDAGYQMETQELDMDLEASQAWSNVTVTAQGPDGTLTAAGLKADNKKGRVIFTGPAKLTLNRSFEGLY